MQDAHHNVRHGMGRVVMKHHKRYVRDIGIPESVEAYTQTIVLKKTLESISLEYRRGAAPDDGQRQIQR
ncbi:hypothetical protein PAPHI01_1389 [Pancytospora philotis]|nr:hypothetical protein PAPHI01_1389 [Pancytospora philotis]